MDIISDIINPLKDGNKNDKIIIKMVFKIELIKDILKTSLIHPRPFKTEVIGPVKL